MNEQRKIFVKQNLFALKVLTAHTARDKYFTTLQCSNGKYNKCMLEGTD